MAISLVNIGTGAEGTSSVIIGYPVGIAAGDLLVIKVSSKYPPGSIPQPPDGGWVSLPNNFIYGGLGAEATDSGQTGSAIFVKEATGNETGTVTIPITPGNTGKTAAAKMEAYRKAAGKVWDLAITTGLEDTPASSVTIPFADPGLLAGDFLAFLFGCNSDTLFTYSAPSISQTSGTFGTPVIENFPAAGGQDLGLITGYVDVVTPGTGTLLLALTVTGTPTAASPAGAGVFLRLREADPVSVPQSTGLPWRAPSKANRGGIASNVIAKKVGAWATMAAALFFGAAVTGSGSVDPGTANVQVNGYAPSIVASSNQNVQPGTGSVILTGYSPSIQVGSIVNPGKAAVIITGYAPTIFGADSKNVQPGVGNVTVTGYAPTIIATDKKEILPGTGNVIVTGYEPSIVASDNKIVSPDTANVIITGYDPSISVSDNKRIDPGTGNVIITGYAPTIRGGVSVSPGTGSVVITGYAPTFTVSNNKLITPGTGNVIITGYAPTIYAPPNVVPGTAHVVINGYAPLIQASGFTPIEELVLIARIVEDLIIEGEMEDTLTLTSKIYSDMVLEGLIETELNITSKITA
jgi:hypothetical protein